MITENYKFIVAAEDQAAAGTSANALADILREADGVLEANRGKAGDQSMDIGTIVSVIASSGATLAIAQGLRRVVAGAPGGDRNRRKGR